MTLLPRIDARRRAAALQPAGVSGRLLDRLLGRVLRRLAAPAPSRLPDGKGGPRRLASRLLALPLLLAAAAATAGEVSVAVAANFARPLARIAEGFTSATGHQLKVSAGPTGRFFSQISAGGAPFEVLIAADDETPRRLIETGHAVPGSAFTYAIGQLVLWSAQPGFVDAQGAVLAAGGFTRLAIANPKVAPYGQAAMEVLQARGLSAAVGPKIVMGDSIAQAHQFVLSGNAELGFIALSQVFGPGIEPRGSMWRVPPSLHAELRQDAVLLKAGEANPAARALLDYLKSPAARAVITAYGYR